jgi:hypothetical protein
VYYQYCLQVPCRRDDLVRGAIRKGVDLEMRHVDKCTDLPLFAESRIAAPGAECAFQAVQVPVYSALTDRQVRRVAEVVRGLAATLPAATPARAGRS